MHHLRLPNGDPACLDQASPRMGGREDHLQEGSNRGGSTWTQPNSRKQTDMSMEQNNTVYPTYSCFDDAMEFIDYVACEYKNEDTSMITLLHGLMTGDDGAPHAHAWVEDASTRTAIFAGIWKGDKIYF